MTTYKILHLEDDSLDAELVSNAFANADYQVEIEHVETIDAFYDEIINKEFDIALIDYSIVNFNIIELVAKINEADHSFPVVIVSGAIDDERAVTALKEGVTDYVLKDKLFRLPAVVKRAINESILARENEELLFSYEQFAQTVPAGFYKANVEGKCTHANDGLMKMLGHTSQDMLMGDKWLNFVHPDDRERVRTVWDEAISHGREFEIETQLLHQDGSAFWIISRARPEKALNGKVKGYFGVVFDVTRLKEVELKLQELSYYDTLTNLPNRRYCREFLEKTVASAKRYDERLAVFFVDLDNFKQINDTKGHAFGDKFLEIVGDRLKKLLRTNDFVARLGGDEFVLCMVKYSSGDDIILMAERVMESFSMPFLIQNETIHASVSVGIAMYHGEDDTADALLQRADLALYRAKSMGRANYQFYSQEMHTQLNEQFKIKSKLFHAIENNEFFLVYQPHINATTKEVAGFEVLLRWHNAELGEISPAYFIPIAEKTEHMKAIGTWVFENALEQHTKWNDKLGDIGFKDLVMSINISPVQIFHKNVTDDLIKKIKSADIPPRSILLEITETAYMDDPQLIKEVLTEISAFGASIAVDDFGTGYSSLDIIEKLPINFLKIDTSFVRHMFHDKENIPIIKAIISLSKALNFKVVAEGVETKMQEEVLTKVGCDYLQGFYYSKPMKADEMESYLEKMLSSRDVAN